MDMVRAGAITEAQPAHHPGWDTMSNHLGIAPARIETVSLRIIPGDRILLCTDGLTNMVSDADIARLLRSHADDAECVDALIDTANAAGGRDNITVVVATIARQ
jgi:PPM family protein phosphatase